MMRDYIMTMLMINWLSQFLWSCLPVPSKKDNLAINTFLLRWQVSKCPQERTLSICTAWKHIHTSLNSSLWATASKHSWPVLSTESVNSTNSPLSSWIRVTRQLLLETVYLRVLLSFKPNGRGMFHTYSRGRSSLSPEKLLSLLSHQKLCECSKSWGSSSTDRSEKCDKKNVRKSTKYHITQGEAS